MLHVNDVKLGECYQTYNVSHTRVQAVSVARDEDLVLCVSLDTGCEVWLGVEELAGH